MSHTMPTTATEAAETTAGGAIPTCLTRCCRDWIAPFLHRGGRCGYCGVVPEFIRLLPESEWVTPRPPIRPEGF